MRSLFPFVMAAKKRSSLLEFALIFAIVYFGTQFFMQWFFPQEDTQSIEKTVIVSAVDSSLSQGGNPELTITNNTDTELTLPSRCPMPPVDVFLVQNPNSGQQNLLPLQTEETDGTCEELAPIATGEKVTVSLAPWKYALFGTLGTYEVQVPGQVDEESEEVASLASTRITVSEPPFYIRIFRTFVTKPLFNALVFIASLSPGYNLGIAIILLTILVKLILFFPTQHALEGQKEMQKLQPKLEELKKKYKENPQKMQQETMKLWKEHNINPFQSCLPMLLQFPVLIGLFFVIRDSSTIEASQHLLYSVYQNLDWSFGTNFLGMDLLEPEWFVMPPALVIMQYLQMKLSFAIAKKKKAQKEDVIDVSPKKKKKKEKKSSSPDMGNMQEMQQKMMLYGLPLMIGVFAFQFPAAVSLYWLMSTLFAIGQQIVVNRKTL